jgi:NTE family protein
LSQLSVLRLLDPAWSAAGIFRAERVLSVVRCLVGDTLIEELPIPFTAVATDMIAGESRRLQCGPLDAAIRASIAIPGVISPCVLDGRVLADGGILEPLPVAPLAGVHTDLRLAVNVNGDDDPRPYQVLEPSTSNEWWNRLLHNASAFIDSGSAPSLLGRFAASGRNGAPVALTGNPTGGPAARLSGVEVMSRSIDAVQAALVNNQLAMYPPDVVVDVPRSACRVRDFHRANEIIEIGQARAARALDAWERDTRLAARWSLKK